MTSPSPRPWPTTPAHRIRGDAEALAAAQRLAESFRPGAGERDRDRRLPVAEFDAFSASGLGAITVPCGYGGADVSNVTLAEVIAILSAADASLDQLPPRTPVRAVAAAIGRAGCASRRTSSSGASWGWPTSRAGPGQACTGTP